MTRNITAAIQSGRVAEFLRCEQAGMSASEIAARLNVTKRTVTRWRQRHHLSHCPPQPKRPESVHEAAERLLDQGCSFSEAGRTVGVSASTIAKWFPERHAWSHQECVEFAVLVRTLGKVAA